jgi:hypothetical protein
MLRSQHYSPIDTIVSANALMQQAIMKDSVNLVDVSLQVVCLMFCHPAATVTH